MTSSLSEHPDTPEATEERSLHLLSELFSGTPLKSAQDYILAFIYASVLYAEEPQEELLSLLEERYADLEEACSLEERLALGQELARLAPTLEKEKGLALWVPLMKAESHFRLRSAAAHAAATLGSPDMSSQEVLARFCQFVLEEGDASLLEGLFLSCDKRVLLPAEECWNALPEESRHIMGFESSCLSLPALLFFTDLLKKTEEPREKANIVDLLASLPHDGLSSPPVTFLHPFPESHPDYEHPQVIDAITPLPASKFLETIPQVIHTWTCPEFLPRFLPEIASHLSPEEVLLLKECWNDPQKEIE